MARGRPQAKSGDEKQEKLRRQKRESYERCKDKRSKSEGDEEVEERIEVEKRIGRPIKKDGTEEEMKKREKRREMAKRKNVFNVKEDEFNALVTEFLT